MHVPCRRAYRNPPFTTQRHTRPKHTENTPEYSTTVHHTHYTKTAPKGTQIKGGGSAARNREQQQQLDPHNRQKHPYTHAKAHAQAQHRPTYIHTYLDGAIAHVGDAERKRGPALVDFDLFPVGRQHLAEADAPLRVAEHLEVGNRQKGALEIKMTPAAGKGGGGAAEGGGWYAVRHELMAKQGFFLGGGLHGQDGVSTVRF